MNEEHRIKAKLLNDTGAIHANISSNDNTGEQATTQRKGVLRIATDEEALEGELNNVAITPHTLNVVNNEHNSSLTAQINAIQQSEDNEMSDIVTLLTRRTENLINLNDE